MWLSLVEHVLREHGVGGSNPLIPTSNSKGLRFFRSPFFCVKIQRGTKRGTKKMPLGNKESCVLYDDFRRRLRTRFMGIGVDDAVAERIHLAGENFYGIMAVWNWYNYNKEKRLALAQWARKLCEIVGIESVEQPAEIIALRFAA